GILYSYDNRMTNLDVSNNLALYFLNCGQQDRPLTVIYTYGQDVDTWKKSDLNSDVIWKQKE
ncbi:MAG: hypothetical protein IIU20_03840, partial [Bacteroidales bacterium]|nr:hypothetical protein [Bacteroidales bacterium]